MRISSVCWLYLLCLGGLQAAERHVTVAGSDQKGDGSEARPYASVQKAAQNLVPGTTITLHPGTYRGGISLSELEGTASAPIIIRGKPGGARPLITGGNNGLHLSKVRYLKLEHLEIADVVHNGVNCDDGGERENPDATRYVIFKDLYIHDVGGTGNQDGLKLSGVDDYSVIDCVIERTGGGMSGSGIDHVGCHRGVIQGCTFRDMSANGIQCKGGSEDIEIRACRFVNAGQRGVNIGGSTGFPYFRPPLSKDVANVEARNIRVIANIFERGIAPIAFVGSDDCLVANNTIINPSQWFWRILQEQRGDATYQFLPARNGRFVNNLIYFARAKMKGQDTNVGGGVDADSFSFSHNLYYAHDDAKRSRPSWLKPEKGTLVGEDPKLLNPSSGRYHVAADSPARGNGLLISAAKRDFDGKPFTQPLTMGALN